MKIIIEDRDAAQPPDEVRLREIATGRATVISLPEYVWMAYEILRLREKCHQLLMREGL